MIVEADIDLRTADLARLGETGRRELIERLADPDSAVRYWAATGLMCFDWDADVKQNLIDSLQDESISVSLAAADALGRAGHIDIIMPALQRALKSDLLWARLRAAANLSYYSSEQLRPMKPLIPDLRAALQNAACFGPDHSSHMKSAINLNVLNGQRDTIVGRWVIGRLIKRIELA